MKRFVCILALALSALPAWSAAKKITVAELTDMLKSMHDQKKPDADVAAALKQVQLSELLSRDTMNSFGAYSPGPVTNEQIYVLEARSAIKPPPAVELPSTAAPDAAAQKAILDKASEYATKTWAQLPAITATKMTLRFQDNVEAVGPGSGLTGGAKNTVVSTFVSPYQFVHYIGSTESAYSSDHGIEKLPADKTRWGANSMIALQEPDPSLATVLQDAQNGGTITWLRWENVNGKAAAVFAFQVPKKKSHLNTNICCFPNVDQAGLAHSSSPTAGGLPDGTGGASGNLQISTDYSNHFKANGVPYHGEMFIDPPTGIVVRMVTQLELKQTDVLHQQDTRIDYAPVKVGDKDLVLPLKTVINTEVVPNGDSQAAGKFSTRATLFTIEYKNYQLK